MRIAIVNDMPMAVEVMRRVIMSSSKHDVVWTARDGAEAIAGCQRDRPDLVLMDLMMPGIDGVEATRRIMAASPCPILVVTATVETNVAKIFEAMGAGALDVVQTPTVGKNVTAQSSASFLYKIDATFRLISESKEGADGADLPPPTRANAIVAIGASAGGPAALAKVIGGLPADFPAAVVVIQHVDAQFAPGLATWLDGVSKLSVRVAVDGDMIEKGTVFVAGTNEHLILGPDGILHHTTEPAGCSYRPSVDVFYESLLRNWRGKMLGVLLTGMGRDGALGLKHLRDAGHHTIGQDRTTSAVWGMPKAAAELGAVVEEVALEKIAEAITRRIHATPTPQNFK